MTNLDRIVTFYKRGDKNKWHAAIAARNISGEETQYLAQELLCRHDTIENLRNAGKTWEILYMWGTHESIRKLLKKLRRELTISHWYKLGRKRNQYELDNEMLLGYLVEALSEKWPAWKMGYQIDVDHKEAPVNYYEKSAKLMIKWAKELTRCVDTPDELFVIASKLVEDCEEWE